MLFGYWFPFDNTPAACGGDNHMMTEKEEEKKTEKKTLSFVGFLHMYTLTKQKLTLTSNPASKLG